VRVSVPRPGQSGRLVLQVLDEERPWRISTPGEAEEALLDPAAPAFLAGGYPDWLRALCSAIDADRELAEAIGDRHLATWASLYRARLALMTGAAAHARHEAGILAQRASKSGIGAAQVLARVLEARAALALSDPTGAEAAIAAALAIRDELGGLEEDEGELHAVQAQVLEALGRSAEAAAARERGARWLGATARRIADPVWRERFVRDVAAHRELQSVAP